MGFFRAVSGLFGSSANAGKVIDVVGDSVRGVGTWIDEQKLSEEERVKFMIQAGQAHLELIKATADENSIRSVTRRWLAWGIASVVCSSFIVGMGFAIAGRDEVVKKIVDLSEAYSLGWAFVSVVTFYFGVSIFRAKPAK